MNKIDVIIKVEADVSNIEKTLKSIASQTILPDLNIFVVINCLNGFDAVNEVLEKYNITACIHELDSKNENFARAYCIPDCITEYVVFMDASDTVECDFFEKLYNYANSKKADIVFFNTNFLNAMFHSHKDYKKDELISKQEYILLDPCMKNKMYKRLLFDNDDIYFNSYKYGELAVIPALSKYADKIYYLEDAKYHSLDIYKTNFEARDSEIIDAINKLYERLKNTEFLEELEYLYINILLNTFSKIFLNNKQYILVNLCSIELGERFLNWRKNRIYKQKESSYKLYANVAYLKSYWLMKTVLKINKKNISNN